MCRVTAEGEVEQIKKKKDDVKKPKKGRVTKISDASDEDADGGGWEAVKGGIATMVVSAQFFIHSCLSVLREHWSPICSHQVETGWPPTEKSQGI